MAAVDEVRLLADAAENVEPPTEPFRFHADPLADDETDHNRFMTWLVQEFLQRSPAHALFLQIGMNGALVFDEAVDDLMAPASPPERQDRIADDLRTATGLVLQTFRQLQDEGSLWGDLEEHYACLRKALGLRKNFPMKRVRSLPVSTLLSAWPVCLDSSDSVIPTVFHFHAPVAIADVDWAWLRQGVAEMRERGESDAGVILLPNGQIITGPVMPAGAPMPFKLADPDDQVPFLDRSHGIGVLRLTTWSELQAGALFGETGNETSNVPSQQA